MILILILAGAIAAAYLSSRWLWQDACERCPRCDEWTASTIIREYGYCFTCCDDLWQEYQADMCDPDSTAIIHVGMTEEF